MKKILTTILIMITILYTSSVFATKQFQIYDFYEDLNEESRFENAYYNFNSQIYTNYSNRKNLYNNNIKNQFGEYQNQKEGIYTITKYLFLKNNKSSLIYASNNSLSLSSSNATSLYNYNIEKDTFTTESTNSALPTISLILYTHEVIYDESTGKNIKYHTGSIHYSTLFINNKNDGSIVIFNPQNNDTKDITLYVYNLDNEYEIIINMLRYKGENNEIITNYKDNYIDTRSWAFVGEDITKLGIKETGNYYIRLFQENECIAVSPIFSVGYVEKSEDTGDSGTETPGGDTGNSGTEAPGGDTGDTGTNDGDKNNDYITNEPIYDENGELAEEQTRTGRKYIKRFQMAY